MHHPCSRCRPLGRLGSYLGALLLLHCLQGQLGLRPAAAADGPPAAADPRPPLVDYRARAGDTPASIARRLYGNAKRADLVLRYNELGPPPHLLREGQVLQVLADAWLAATSGVVEVYELTTPGARPAAAGTPLDRGTRVATGRRGSAEVAFSDETQVQLMADSLLLIAGVNEGQVRGLPALTDTTLLAGSLRLLRPPGSGTIALGTQAAQIRLQGGEGLLRVDGDQATHLSVIEGRFQVIGAERSVSLRAGQGIRIEAGRPPGPPRALPAAPEWTDKPTPIILTLAATASIRGALVAAPGQKVSLFHVQVTRDDRGADLVLDALQPEGRLPPLALPMGAYQVRVSALGEGQLEGPAQTTRFRVVEARILPGGAGQPTRLVLPPGLHCSLDGGESAAVYAALPLAPARSHLLRCAAAPGGRAGLLTIDAKHLGRSEHDVELGAARIIGPFVQRRIRLRLRDGAGLPVTGAKVRARPERGTLAGAVREEEPGTYAVTVLWPDDGDPGTLHLAVGEGEEIDLPLPPGPPLSSVLVPPPVRAKEPPPRPGALELAAGAGIHISDMVRGHRGAAFLLEIGRRIDLPMGVLAIALRAGVEDFSYGPGVRAPCRDEPGDPPMLCVRSRRGDYADLFARTTLAFSLPITYRLREASDRLVPYLGIAPQLILDFTQSSAAGFVNRVVKSEHPAVLAMAGMQLRPFGPRVPALFLEGGYRHVEHKERRPNDASLSGGYLLLGLRATP